MWNAASEYDQIRALLKEVPVSGGSHRGTGGPSALHCESWWRNNTQHLRSSESPDKLHSTGFSPSPSRFELSPWSIVLWSLLISSSILSVHKQMTKPLKLQSMVHFLCSVFLSLGIITKLCGFICLLRGSVSGLCLKHYPEAVCSKTGLSSPLRAEIASFFKIKSKPFFYTSLLVLDF